MKRQIAGERSYIDSDQSGTPRSLRPFRDTGIHAILSATHTRATANARLHGRIAASFANRQRQGRRACLACGCTRPRARSSG